MRNRISRSLFAALVIAAATTVALGAQSPQSGGAGAAGTQTPTNVNVVNVPTVIVGNSTLQAIPVKGPAKEPVHLNFSGTHNPSIALITLGTYQIPAGKRLVVEHFSMTCRSQNSEQELQGELGVNDVDLTWLPMTTVPFTAFPGQTKASGALPVSAYIDEGLLSVRAIRTNPNNSTFCFAAVLGYLTPLQ